MHSTPSEGREAVLGHGLRGNGVEGYLNCWWTRTWPRWANEYDEVRALLERYTSVLT